MFKIEVLKLDEQKDYLRKYEVSVTEVRKILAISRDKAKQLVSCVRATNYQYYKKNGFMYNICSVSPLHLMLYLGWSREEFFDFIKHE